MWIIFISIVGKNRKKNRKNIKQEKTRIYVRHINLYYLGFLSVPITVANSNDIFKPPLELMVSKSITNSDDCLPPP